MRLKSHPKILRQKAIAEVVPAGAIGWKVQTRRIVSQISFSTQSIENAFGKAKWSALTKGIGFGLDFLVGAGIQVATDWHNPHLTGLQKFRRAGVAGIGSGISGLAGGAALGAVGTAICAPCGVIGAIAGGLGGGAFWSQTVQPVIFQNALFAEERRFMPRGN